MTLNQLECSWESCPHVPAAATKNYGDRSPRNGFESKRLLQRYQFDTTVLDAAFIRSVVGNRLGFSYPFAVSLSVCINTFDDQIVTDSFRDVDAPLAGQAGLDKLLSDGVLRRAQQSDLLEWKSAQRRSQGLPPLSVAGGQNEAPLSLPLGAYVVQGRMTFPAGLYGAHSAIFIVLRGVPSPQGNPGHSAVYDWNALTCSGALCRSLALSMDIWSIA